jgi:hypothetical protein
MFLQSSVGSANACFNSGNDNALWSEVAVSCVETAHTSYLHVSLCGTPVGFVRQLGAMALELFVRSRLRKVQ